MAQALNIMTGLYTYMTKEQTKKEIHCMSQAFIEVMRLGVKDNKDAFKSILDLLQVSGVTKNLRGNLIDEPMIKRQYHAMMHDIRKNRVGWYSKWKILKSSNNIQLVLKSQ